MVPNLPVNPPLPPAIARFAEKVPDPVGLKNPLLAENRIVPSDPPPELRAGRQDESSQSFDAIPSSTAGFSNARAGQSKSVTLYEETLEALNFLNLLILKIVP